MPVRVASVASRPCTPEYKTPERRANVQHIQYNSEELNFIARRSLVVYLSVAWENVQTPGGGGMWGAACECGM